jgi:membrane protein
MRRGRQVLAMPRRSWRCVKQTWDNWLAHDGPRLAASLSLYSLLSLAPLVILSIAIASLAFGRTAARNTLINEMRGVMGPDGARTIEAVIQHGYGKTARASSP